jgi:hypothetical protein
MPRGQVWPEVQSFCAWFVAKKRVPDGSMATGRFFWREQGTRNEALHSDLTACFQRGGNLFPAF